ncbi:uncharacterized protein N7477_000612 [Penicillium maclennaniae]|uniref:uncharacterized protein n=1 Tax=Penicillium maclennaniae TaxID=1343394 RepID=UPI002540F8EB|nr:uncharacterized protein N7477_000612 [Penicillium maclennaniae]KAJ5684267.1 hypothetical protein N7477_000612 [Penicillium maclennaniae]
MSPSDAPDGSSLIWILDHVNRYQGSYEIPLRTMYQLNLNPTKASGNRSPETAFSPRSSPRNSTSTTKSSRSSQDASVDAAADFRSALENQLSRLPSQPTSLPPSFSTNFIRKVFPGELDKVDFPQALTALDYLRSLEDRWKKEVHDALKRLKVSEEDAAHPGRSELVSKYPGSSLLGKTRQIQALYTQVYVGLRRWTMINEMLLEPTRKANHMALLNVLFPPPKESDPSPTPQLTVRILQSHRDGYFRIINSVHTRGTSVLDPVIQQGAANGHATNWPLICDTLHKYLNLVNDVIDECMLVNEPASLEEDKSLGRNRGRKFDSEPRALAKAQSQRRNCLSSLPPPNITTKNGGSILERLAREVRALGDKSKSRNLRKMKSTTTLNVRPGSQQSHESSFFEIDDDKRKRLIFEANYRKNSQSQVFTQ